MNKTRYIAPALRTVALGQADALLLTASTEEESILGNGGGTGTGGVTEGGAKGRSGYNVWNDDWSR